MMGPGLRLGGAWERQTDERRAVCRYLARLFAQFFQLLSHYTGCVLNPPEPLDFRG